jgi:hypothetical protein
MATTTNYGWTTPNDTDLVKDGAAAIRTLGNSVDTTTKALNPETTLGDIAYRSATSNTNTRLAIGSAGQVLTVAAGVPSWASPSDQTPLTTKGDVFTFSTVDARLGVGANGTVLTADSAEATGLKWAAPASGGKVLQVVTATTTTSTTSTSTTWADTGLSASITPSSVSSKILVMTSQSFRQTADQNYVYGGFRLQRASTNIFGSNAASSPTNSVVYVASSAAFELNSVWNYSYLDSPSTTSSTTYKTQQAVQAAANNQTIISQFTSHPSSIILLEIGA